MRASAALLAALLASPAAAADVCGRVEVLGRPLPAGFVTLSGGPTEKSLVRVRDGRFCARDVEPGRYAVEASPLRHWLPARVSPDHLDVPEHGLTHAALTLSGETPKDDWARLTVVLVSPDEKSAKQPALVVVHTKESGYHFAWAEPGGLERRVALMAAHGQLRGLHVLSPGLAVKSVEPSYRAVMRDGLKLHPGQDQRFTLGLARSGVIRGRVLLPDGSPFRPDRGADHSKRALFAFFLNELFLEREVFAAVDEHGGYEAEVPAGDWELRTVWEGDGFKWSLGRSFVVPVAAGQTVERDYAFSENVELTAKADLPPLFDADYSTFSPMGRWVRGRLSSKPFTPTTPYEFLVDYEHPIAFVQNSGGEWRPLFSADERLRPRPGRYDVFLVETRGWPEPPWLRVLSVKNGVELAAGDKSEVVFGAKDAGLLPQGRGEVRGRLDFKPRVPARPEGGAYDIADLYGLLAPIVNFYDAKGRYVGTAVAGMPEPVFQEAISAFHGGDMDRVRRLADRGPRSFAIKGLAPGRYRAEAIAYGHERRSFELSVDERSPARLEIDLAKAACASFAEPGAASAFYALPGASASVVEGRACLSGEGYASAPVPRAADWSRLRGALRFPEGRKPERALVGLQTDRGLALAWAKPSGGAAKFSLDVPPGRVTGFFVRAEGLGVESMTPPFSVPSHESMTLGPAQEQTLDVALAPAGGARARVLLPDGAPFSPGPGRAASIYAANLYASQEFAVPVGADGYAELPGLAEGFWQLQVRGEGEDFAWAAGPARLSWIEAGKTDDMTFTLGSAAFARVDGKGAPVEPLWQSRYAAHHPKSRFILGFKAGRPGPASDPIRLTVQDAADVTFAQNDAGGWVADANGGPRAAAEPGRYDLYLVELGLWVGPPSVRVLAEKKGIALSDRRETPFSFKAEELAPAGEAELRGAVRASRKWDFAALRTATDFAALYRMLVPVISVYDARGRLAGAAMGAMSRGAMSKLSEAVARGDLMRSDSALYGEARDFRLKGLAPGKYRARVSVYGYPEREIEFEAKAGSPAEFTVDMDKDT